jgi:hypothetical protein
MESTARIESNAGEVEHAPYIEALHAVPANPVKLCSPCAGLKESNSERPARGSSPKCA